MRTMRYFDHNATTPLSEAARSAWLEANDSYWLNPSSPYRGAAAVRVRMDACRVSLAERFEVEPDRIVYTSGATEANNAVIRHWVGCIDSDLKVGVNPTEHPSVLEPARALLNERVEWLEVDENGCVVVEALEALMRAGRLGAVSVMAANNETGVIQPWPKIAELCKEFSIPLHCDASQWVGKLPLKGLSQCSYVSACGHKFGAPKGVGFLVLPDVQDPCRLLLGGAQEGGHRAGTEDFAGVLAVNAALGAAIVGNVSGRDAFIRSVKDSIPGVRIIGEGTPRLWNTVSVVMPRNESARWIAQLERAGFQLSAGAACSTGKSTLSEVLLRLGLSESAAGRVLRVSSGSSTTLADWEALAEAIANVWRQLADEASASNVIAID